MRAAQHIVSDEKFRADLRQLKELYDIIPPTLSVNRMHRIVASMLNEIPNPNYPEESLEEFVGKMMEHKKKSIEAAVLNQK